VNVVKGLEKHEGIHLSYISPFNEPDGSWNWLGPKQEGSPATNREMARFVRLLGQQFKSNAISTQILLNEASDFRCLYRRYNTNWQRGHAIQAFFSKDSVDTYVGNVPNVSHMIVGHSYWTDTPLDSLIAIRSTLRDSLNKYKLKFWMTELCIMGNDREIGGGGGYDRTMKTALYVGRVIHHDLVIAGARSWQWWRAVGGDYKDGLLHELDDGGATDGTVVDSKLLWVMGNYSRFIRPGAMRLDVSTFDANNHLKAKGDTDPHGLMCSAYRNKDGKLVFVVLNYAHSDKQITFNAQSGRRWIPYITSDKQDDNLRPMSAIQEGSTITIPQRSVVTFVSR
jgi:O-glycosyl hydrolase